MLKIIILVAENIQSTSFSQLVIHFSDVIAGGEFKQLVMDDIRKAFSRMRERELDTDTESEKQGLPIFRSFIFHIVSLTTCYVCDILPYPRC